jgi:hypothetical protein
LTFHLLKIQRTILETYVRTRSRFVPAKSYPVDAEVRTQSLRSDWRVGRIFEAVSYSLRVGIRLAEHKANQGLNTPETIALAMRDLLTGGSLNSMSCRWKAPFDT